VVPAAGEFEMENKYGEGKTEAKTKAKVYMVSS
jgi:hypothetical protein